MSTPSIRYSVSGVVAKDRISPLAPAGWTDTTRSPEIIPDFLWENAPRRESKEYRDSVKVYSHLPNGTNVLDSKWALGRLYAAAKSSQQDPLLASLETHCFRGLDGFQNFAQKIKLVGNTNNDASKEILDVPKANYPDIMDKDMDLSTAPDPANGPSNLWVVKDATANGAGGVWVVGPETAAALATPGISPLYPEHRYVAQRYVWPPVLFGGRKCHVRVYGLLTSDGRAFVHHRAFLHVANDPFTTNDATEKGSYQDSIHISNCCANSHDATKFSGEILADFEQTEYTEKDGQTVVPLASFFPSVKACLSFLAQQSFPFLQGGQANNGFEYMGIDFMLSYNQDKTPVAYILEINAPPSQDSATGLPHAENLHNQVIRDLLTLWVQPQVTHAPVFPGGWRCVYTSPQSSDAGELIAPSKAAIINKIRWSMFEKKAQRLQDAIDAKEDSLANGHVENGTTIDGTMVQPSNRDRSMCGNSVSKYARSQFPFFSTDVESSHRIVPQVFFENAGGSQVAQQVITAVSESLICRHRSVIGSKTKAKARQCIRRLLGAEDDDLVVLGANATTLLISLADRYVRCGLLQHGDEVVVSTENHSANFDPWVQAAKDSGAVLKLWTPCATTDSIFVDGTIHSRDLSNLVTPSTRVVAIPHASNLLGQIQDLALLTTLIDKHSASYAHIVVDGVAATPHVHANLQHLPVDWYIVSCHKLFGPHLGALCGKRKGAVKSFVSMTFDSSSSLDDDTALYKLFETGTINYEGCAGVVGLGDYFAQLASFQGDLTMEDCKTTNQSVNPSTYEAGEISMESSNATLSFLHGPIISRENVYEAYRRIRIAEIPLVTALLKGLRRSKNVRILDGSDHVVVPYMARVPTISFIHAKYSPHAIICYLGRRGITCRSSSFLCTEHLANDFDFDHVEGVVRISLAHYNTMKEVNLLLAALGTMESW